MTHRKPSAEVVDLAARGRVIEAIERHREETGLGLAEAKSVVDGLPRDTATAGGGERPPSDRASRQAAAFLAATILGLGGVLVTGTGLFRAHVASSWPGAEGEIVRSSETSDGVEVEYTFEVQGRTHRGSRISYTLTRGPGFTRGARSRYPAGSRVTVRYDPTDPTRSVLEVRIPSLYLGVFIVSLMALAWGLARWIQEAQRERVNASG